LVALLSLFLVVAVVPVVVAGTNEHYEAGLKFLEANKKKLGVSSARKSGLQYKILAKGNGKANPTLNSPCKCHYEGKLLDGTIFDSSYARGSPSTFAPNQVIKGWTEMMQLMVVGDKFELYIPSDLGYGDSGNPPKIPGGSVLIFVLEILEIQGDTVAVITDDDDDDDDTFGADDDQFDEHFDAVDEDNDDDMNEHFKQQKYGNYVDEEDDDDDDNVGDVGDAEEEL